MLFIMSIIFPPVIFFSKLFIYLINNLYNMNNVKAFFYGEKIYKISKKNIIFLKNIKLALDVTN